MRKIIYNNNNNHKEKHTPDLMQNITGKNLVFNRTAWNLMHQQLIQSYEQKCDPSVVAASHRSITPLLHFSEPKIWNDLIKIYMTRHHGRGLTQLPAGWLWAPSSSEKHLSTDLLFCATSWEKSSRNPIVRGMSSHLNVTIWPANF